jgi:hypothetical protein
MITSRLAVVLLCATLPMKSAIAQEEYASFQSFYGNSSKINWPIIIGVAAVAGGVTWATGGAGVPFAASIGTWIGGAMGLNGIAATNAGLALLGGGSIAAGGLGIAGGSAVIASTSSVAIDAIFEVGVQVWSEYNYQKLAEKSVLLPTLGLPVSESGSLLYETAVKSIRDRKMDGVETDEDVEFIRSVIDNAIKQTSLESQKELKVSSFFGEQKIVFTTEEKARNEALIALLFFIINDFENSRKHAHLSIEEARKAEIDRGLPAFLYATSSLYNDDLNFPYITDQYFEYSIQSQADTDFIPTMFSIYMDRMILRFEEGKLSADNLEEIRLLMDSDNIPEKHRATNYVLLLTKYNALLGKLVEGVSAISESTNSTIRNSPGTLNRLKASVQLMALYAEKSEIVVEELNRLSSSDEVNEKVLEDLRRYTQNWSILVRKQHQLASKVREFEERQSAEILARDSAEAAELNGVNRVINETGTVAEEIVRLIRLQNTDSRVD